MDLDFTIFEGAGADLVRARTLYKLLIDATYGAPLSSDRTASARLAEADERAAAARVRIERVGDRVGKTEHRKVAELLRRATETRARLETRISLRGPPEGLGDALDAWLAGEATRERLESGQPAPLPLSESPAFPWGVGLLSACATYALLVTLCFASASSCDGGLCFPCVLMPVFEPTVSLVPAVGMIAGLLARPSRPRP